MKTLLLDKVFKPISFIGFRKVLKLVVCDKVEILSEWNDTKFFGNYNLPAIVRLKEYIRKQPLILRFSYNGIFKRDRYCCQYTGKELPRSQLTVDHVIPRCRGGLSTWENCVTASLEVNVKKGNKLPDEVGLKLIRKPSVPSDPLFMEFSLMDHPHPDWKYYFQI